MRTETELKAYKPEIFEVSETAERATSICYLCGEWTLMEHARIIPNEKVGMIVVCAKHCNILEKQ